MDRRTFLMTIAGGVFAVPLAAGAQQPGKLFRIGILSYLPATDPVGSRFREVVLAGASLARPGANVTGISVLNTELIGKQLQMLKEVSPKLSRVAVRSNPTTSTHRTYLRQAEDAARSLNVRLVAP